MVYQFISLYQATSALSASLRAYCATAIKFLATANLMDQRGDGSDDSACVSRVFRFVSSLDSSLVDKTLVLAVLINKIQSAPSLGTTIASN